MSNYEQIKFDVVDFKNENVLSSYALEKTPLTFIPKLSNFSYVDVLWDFGDGTTSLSYAGKHSYSLPGRYVVNLTVYDCYSNAILSTEYKIVEIYDYLPHTFKVDFDESSYEDNIIWKNGKISGPITIKTYFPLHKDATDIYYRISGSDSEYYFEDTPYKFRHLEKTYSFYEKTYNNYLKDHQFNEIDRITTTNTSLYAKISGTQIINTTENDPDSFFVGLSGQKEVYFKDDSINTITIDLFFDKNYYDKNGLNILKVSLSADIVENDEVDHLSITSNGLDGEYYQIQSFQIDSKKFANVEIPFVVKIKDLENFSVKNFPNLSASDVTISVLSTDVPIDSSYYTIKDVTSFYGSARGSISFNFDTKIHDIQLSASLTTTNDQGSAYTLTGITNSFDVYPQNYVSFVKKNEDFDAKETFKGLRFQEFLLDKDVLFEDFMGSVFGTLSSSYDTLGKKIYEKICNFVENTQDVDRDEIFALISQMKMLGTDNDVFNSNLFAYPEKIKRIIDLGSIGKNKLIGYNNKFKENFDIKGHTSKETYGTNLGEKINTATYTVSAGTPIVALEKFSNTYVLLNTTQPLEQIYISENTIFYNGIPITYGGSPLLYASTDSTTISYPLSSYDEHWGWTLVLPTPFDFSDIDKYYLFFEYVGGYDNTLADYTTIYTPTLYSTISSENIIYGEDDLPILTESEEYILSEFDFDYVDEFLNLTLRDTLYQSLSLVK